LTCRRRRGRIRAPAAKRPGDAEGIGHRRGLEPQQMPGGDRRTKRPGRARRVKAAGFIGVPGGAADADRYLVAGDQGGAHGAGRSGSPHQRHREMGSNITDTVSKDAL